MTRLSTPTLLGEFDLIGRTVTRHVELPTGQGAWAVTVSHGYVFVGTYSNGAVHRFDPANGTFTSIDRLGTVATYVWDLTTAPDGTVYAVTFPDGKVWEIDPITMAVRDLGAPVPGASYGRYVAANDTTVFAIINTPGGHLMAIDRATGSYTDLTPPLTGTGVTYSLVRIGSNGRVYLNGGGYLIDMLPDGSDVRYIPRPAGSRSTNEISPQPDGTVYVSVTPSGTVYRYRTGDTELTEIATPLPGSSAKLTQLDDSTLVGAAGTGLVWYLDQSSGALEFVDLSEVGLPESGQLPMSIAYAAPTDDGPTVLLGTTGRAYIHRPFEQKLQRVFVSGEPKTMVALGGKAYAAIYPSTEIIELDPATGAIKSLGHIRNEQYRPSEMVYDRTTGLIAIASGASFDKLTGALTLLDPRTGAIEVHRELLPNQNLRGVAVADGIAYVAGDVYGEGNVLGTEPEASIAAFDIGRRTVLWRTSPLPGHKTLSSIAVHDGVIYGLMARPAGVWFALDAETLTVLRQGTLPAAGQVFVHRGSVFACVNGGRTTYQLGPDLAEPRLLVETVSGQLSDLAPEDLTWHAWGVSGQELARIDLNTER